MIKAITTSHKEAKSKDFDDLFASFSYNFCPLEFCSMFSGSDI
jgi:hypothetical protein